MRKEVPNSRTHFHRAVDVGQKYIMSFHIVTYKYFNSRMHMYVRMYVFITFIYNPWLEIFKFQNVLSV